MNIKLTAIAMAAGLLQIACGGGQAVTDTIPPTVTITDNTPAQNATGAVTFNFDFSEDVVSSFTVVGLTQKCTNFLPYENQAH